MIKTPRIRSFIAQGDGTVTVDWVVLTAAIVGLGIAVLSTVTTGSKSVTEAVPSHPEGTTVTKSFP